MSGSHIWFGSFGKKKNIVSAGIECRVSPAHNLDVVAMPTIMASR
jgi:hypothetical protein